MTERPRILITRAEDVTGERWADYGDRMGRRRRGEPVAIDLTDWRPEHSSPTL